MGIEQQQPPIDPGLRIGSVELAVSDLERSADFYERVLGLGLISREEGIARLGTDPERPALLLSEIAASTPVPVGSTGLYHVAWLHPSRAALAQSLRRVAGSRWAIEGAADHGVSEALYLSDPDGLGIELYADRPREQWERPADGHGVRMVTQPLDLEDLLAAAATEVTPAMPLGTGIGHMHLKVSDVPRANAFYRDALGFEEQARLPSAAFLAAGGYHHHVGLNSWQSGGAEASPDSAPGLRRIAFELSDSDALAALEQRVAETSTVSPPPSRGHLALRDPDGQLLTFSPS
jgi:catechol 2,3-dioxygenase